MKTKIMFCTMAFLLSAFTGSVFGGTEGATNTFYGLNAGDYIGANGYYNTFIGRSAGLHTTTGDSNTFLGYDAGVNNITGNYNTFLGYFAGFYNTTASENLLVGYFAGFNNITGYNNVFMGNAAGYSNTTGSNSTFLGIQSGYSNTTGVVNTFLGEGAGYQNTTGNYNTYVGPETGAQNIEGSHNVFLGYQAGFFETGSNRLYIDSSNTGTPLIYGEFDNNIVTINGRLGIKTKTPQKEIDLGGGAITVNGADNTGEQAPGMWSWENGRIDFGFGGSGGGNLEAYSKGHTRAGQFKFIYGGGDFGSIVYAQYNPARAPGYQWLDMMTLDKNGYLYMYGGAYTNGSQWIDASSRVYKENVRDLSVDEAMDTLRELSPVKFNYKADSKDTHVGFVAEDVPALVATSDRKGMSPMDVVAVLTKVVQEQQKTIAELSEKLKQLERTLR